MCGQRAAYAVHLAFELLIKEGGERHIFPVCWHRKRSTSAAIAIPYTAHPGHWEQWPGVERGVVFRK